MTRKDFELIAAALKQKRDASYVAGAASLHIDICEIVADALAGTNPRFDRERFLKACGVQQ